MSSLARRMCAISLDGAHVDVDLRVLVDDVDLEVPPPLRPRFLPSDRSRPDEVGEVLVASLSLKAPRMRSEYSQTGQLRRRLLHQHEERRDPGAHRRLGGDEQTRQVDGAPREVLGLDAVPGRRGRGELGARVVLELGQHDDHDGDGAEHHDERDAPLPRPPARAAPRLSGTASSLARDPEGEGLLDGQEDLRRVAVVGAVAHALEHESDLRPPAGAGWAGRSPASSPTSRPTGSSCGSR